MIYIYDLLYSKGFVINYNFKYYSLSNCIVCLSLDQFYNNILFSRVYSTPSEILKILNNIID